MFKIEEGIITAKTFFGSYVEASLDEFDELTKSIIEEAWDAHANHVYQLELKLKAQENQLGANDFLIKLLINEIKRLDPDTKAHLLYERQTS